MSRFASSAGCLLGLILCGCQSGARTDRVADAYAQGAADALKQLYWAKQALEAPRDRTPAGRIMYYRWEDGGTQGDGRKVTPQTVAVPVFIPDPVPASQ